MAMVKGLPMARSAGVNTKAMNRKLLTKADKEALPFLTKKCSDKSNPEFGMWQEDRLVKHIVERMRLSDSERRLRVQRCTQIDVQLSGVVKFDRHDKRRDRDNKAGREPKPVKHNLPLTYAQIDDAVTYCMGVFAPEMNIFEASTTADKQSIAEGLNAEINKHGQTLRYYRELAKVCLNALKYNFGACSVYWEQQTGVVFSADPSVPGQLIKGNGLLWQGNVLKSCDCYNFFYDTSVHPCDLSLRGEYFAQVEPITPFRIKRMNQQNILFGIDRYINQIAPLSGYDSGTFYMAPPIVREPELEQASTGTVNWTQILAPGGPAKDSQPGIELVWFTTWIIPKEFDLSDSGELELWRIAMANGKYITSAVHIEDSHGQLPCSVACPIEDDLRNDQRTYAEMLLPLQHFASFLMNTHVDATRKAIYGITVFDQRLFPGIDLSTEDLIGQRIPMKSSATGVDIDKAFRHYNAAPQTDQNVEMIGKVVELMQKILPTNTAGQVADLERATQYQAAATVQASNRRNLKIARLINDQCLSVIKFQMIYNIYAKLTQIEYADPATGAPIQITPAQLLEANIEFGVSTGLKGLDRLMQISIFKEIFGYLFQIKDASARYDLLGLLAYIAQIAGFQTDLSRFKLQQQEPSVNPVDTQQVQQQQTPPTQTGV